MHAKRAPKHRERPGCDARGQINARKPHKLYHTPVGGKPCFIVLEPVRFCCPACSRTYYDGYGNLVSGVSPHVTEGLRWAALIDITNKMSIASISHKEGPGEAMCAKVLDAAILEAAYLPCTLCIDEFKTNTDRGRMAVGVSDSDLDRPVEVLERPRGDVLAEFFGRFDAGER